MIAPCPLPEFIPTTSPALGFVLGSDGWPLGHLIELFGKEASGKTTIMMLGLKEAFEYHDGERPIALIDIEHRYNPEWAKKLGLPTDELIVVQPESGEQATDIMHKLIRPKNLKDSACAIGFDSVGAASPERERISFEERGAIVGGNAAVMSRNVRTIAPVANLRGTTVFYSNQLRADMEGFRRVMTPGGHALKHALSLRVYLWPTTDPKTKKHDKIDGQDVQVGFEMNFRVIKNTFGPFGRDGKSVFYIRPSRLFEGIGFDIENDIQGLGIMTEVIERSGSYYSYSDVKAQGRDPFFKALKEAGLYDQLLKDVNAKLDTTQSMFENEAEKGEHYVLIDDPEI